MTWAFPDSLQTHELIFISGLPLNPFCLNSLQIVSSLLLLLLLLLLPYVHFSSSICVHHTTISTKSCPSSSPNLKWELQPQGIYMEIRIAGSFENCWRKSLHTSTTEFPTWIFLQQFYRAWELAAHSKFRCDYSSTHLTTCELASSGMTGLMEKNRDKLKWIKYGRSPQLRCNKRKKKKKRERSITPSTHTASKKNCSPSEQQHQNVVCCPLISIPNICKILQRTPTNLQRVWRRWRHRL